MHYTVASSPAVNDKLADIWLRALDRNAVRAASDEIDETLKYRPFDVGLPFGTARSLTVGPLTAIYTVSPDDRMVDILDYAYTP